MTNWTKGPWVIRKLSALMTIDGRVHQVCDKGEYPSAFIPAWNNPNDICNGDAVEAIANAHLIASAPELYDALEALIDTVCYIRGIDMDHYAKDEIKKARKALSKARGEQ